MSLGLCYKLSEFSKHCQVQKNFPKSKKQPWKKNLKPIGKFPTRILSAGKVIESYLG